MYISRVEIDTMNRSKIKDLTHVGAFHSWVEDSFPVEKEEGVRNRKLWRVDELDGRQYLILVSQNKPDKIMLEKYGVKGTALIKNYNPFLDSLKNGDEFYFRVDLNPVISKSRGSAKRGSIEPCYDKESQTKYILDRASLHGFSLDCDKLSIVRKEKVTLKKANFSDIKFIKSVYFGRLRIEDVDRFRLTLLQGIGKHKAYGFGLMTISR